MAPSQCNLPPLVKRNNAEFLSNLRTFGEYLFVSGVGLKSSSRIDQKKLSSYHPSLVYINSPSYELDPHE